MIKFSHTRLLLAAIVAASVAAVPGSASADGSFLTLFVARNGDDSAPCTRVAPCATIQRAVEVAGSRPVTVQLSADTFTGSTTIARDQDVTVLGTHRDSTSRLEEDGTPTFVNRGRLRVSGVEFAPPYGAALIEQRSGQLELTDDTVESSTNGFDFVGGDVFMSDVVFAGGGGDEEVAFTVSGAHVHATDIRPDNPVVVTSGSLDVDHLLTASTLHASGGTTDLTDSSIVNAQRGVVASGSAVVRISTSSFSDDIDALMATDGADVTLVDDTFADPGADDQIVNDGAAIYAAGSVFLSAPAGSGAAPACTGPIVDGGYNVDSDGSCDFTAATSRSQADLPVHPISWRNTFTAYRAPTPESPQIDAIPADATASFDPSIDLCLPGSADQRGQARPVAERCDAGAIELSPVHLNAAVPSRVIYGHPVVVHATVRAAGSPSEQLAGAIDVDTPNTTKRCSLTDGATKCSFGVTQPGNYHVTVRFVPSNAFRGATETFPLKVTRAPIEYALHARPNRPRAQHSFRLAVTAKTSAPSPVGDLIMSVDGRPLPGCHRLTYSEARGHCTVTGLLAGTHRVVGRFAGNSDNRPAVVRQRFTIRPHSG